METQDPGSMVVAVLKIGPIPPGWTAGAAGGETVSWNCSEGPPETVAETVTEPEVAPAVSVTPARPFESVATEEADNAAAPLTTAKLTGRAAMGEPAGSATLT